MARLKVVLKWAVRSSTRIAFSRPWAVLYEAQRTVALPGVEIKIDAVFMGIGRNTIPGHRDASGNHVI